MLGSACKEEDDLGSRLGAPHVQTGYCKPEEAHKHFTMYLVTVLEKL